MLWIKRNLFLALGGLVAVGLLGFGIYFLLGAQSKNAQLEDEIGQTVKTMNDLYNAPVFPGVTNISIAKQETGKLRGALEQMQKFFSAVPAEKVTGLAFRSYRDNTLAELHHLAEQSRTTLPSKSYAFSFETQKAKVDFKEGTFPAIPQQMAEVRSLCRVLFEAHVSPLVNLRRARVSRDDEESNVSSDYLLLKVETNQIAETVTSPYEVTYHCLSSELAAVMQGLVVSSNGFVVKAIHVEPAAEPVVAAGPGQPPPLNPPPDRFPQPRPPPPNRPPGSPGQPFPRPLPGAPPPGNVPGIAGAMSHPAAERSIILLKERRLKVTMLIYVIRALK